MTPSNHGRVKEARERLAAADSPEGNNDPAVRLVELFSPRPAEGSLTLHRAFSVVFDLTDAARQSLAATIDGIRSENENVGLDGVVETYGRRYPIHQATSLAPKVPGSALVPTSSLLGRSASHTSEQAALLEVIDTIDRAILLTSAELRGAEAAASDIETERGIVTNRDAGSAVGATLVMRSEDEEMLEALDAVAPPVTAVSELSAVVDLLSDDPERIRLEAALSQARAARDCVLPGDANDVIVLADLAIAEANGALAEYDMTPGSPTEVLTGQLAALGFTAAPFEAAEVANRLIDESAELETIRARLVRSIELAAMPPEIVELDTARAIVAERQLRISRRLRSQQQLLAVARAESRRLGLDGDGNGAILDLRDEPERPFPILIEEPLADLPARLSGAILSMLLRYSHQTQVICVTDQTDLASWCESVGERADWVSAGGWFAGRSG